MKEQSIKKINTIGKISYIAAVFAKCMVIVGLVVLFVAKFFYNEDKKEA